jgi:hypothetical protein
MSAHTPVAKTRIQALECKLAEITAFLQPHAVPTKLPIGFTGTAGTVEVWPERASMSHYFIDDAQHRLWMFLRQPTKKAFELASQEMDFILKHVTSSIFEYTTYPHRRHSLRR